MVEIRIKIEYEADDLGTNVDAYMTYNTPTSKEFEIASLIQQSLTRRDYLKKE